MNGKFPVVLTIAVLSAFPLTQAETRVGAGVIRFTGHVVESPCRTSSDSTGWRMEACPIPSRHIDVSVQQVRSQLSLSSTDFTPVQAKLVVSRTTESRYFDQQYTLVDRAGKPITTGNFLVTVSMP
ncbi:type 1 fimbrial protein [Pseudomonas juntendi]|uniref:type 1 fimbrial protein n=1 Tax=Pseudomonas TaxID=286 RepID=UPI0034D74ED2